MDEIVKEVYIELLRPRPHTNLLSGVKVIVEDVRIDNGRIYKFLCKGNITEYRYGLTIDIDLKGNNGWYDTKHLPLTSEVLKTAKG